MTATVEPEPEFDASSDDPVWVHGVLVVPVGEASEARTVMRLRSLSVWAVSEPDQLPCVAPLLRRAPLAPHGRKDATGMFATPFSFDLRQVLERPLFRCAMWVHVACRGMHSTPMRLQHRVGAMAGSMPKGLPADHLLAAYDAAARGRSPLALEHFEVALEEPSIADALDRPHLANAAEIATEQAIATAASVPLAAAADWRRRDVLRRDALLADLQHRLASPDAPAFAEAARARLVAEFGRN